MKKRLFVMRITSQALSSVRSIQLVDEHVDHANRFILANPIFQAFRKERALSTIRAFNEAFHQIPPQIAQES